MKYKIIHLTPKFEKNLGHLILEKKEIFDIYDIQSNEKIFIGYNNIKSALEWILNTANPCNYYIKKVSYAVIIDDDDQETIEEMKKFQIDDEEQHLLHIKEMTEEYERLRLEENNDAEYQLENKLEQHNKQAAKILERIAKRYYTENLEDANEICSEICEWKKNNETLKEIIKCHLNQKNKQN